MNGKKWFLRKVGVFLAAVLFVFTAGAALAGCDHGHGGRKISYRSRYEEIRPNRRYQGRYAQDYRRRDDGRHERGNWRRSDRHD